MRQDEHLSALQPGARLHLYTIGAILGAGGFGITYKAREDITDREVAIKEFLPSAFAVRDRNGSTVRPLSEGAAKDFEWGLERFRQEAKLLIDLRHPNIVPVLAYFESNATGYLVMEFQDGSSLGQLLKTKSLTEAETLAIVVPLLDGVEEVHRHNFLHRDIKPENIFVRRDGTPVLLDFGAARQALGEHSKSFTTLLTEGYAPFEQYAGTGNQGPWSDIYALSAVMFRCLMGKAPAEAPRRAAAKLGGIPDPMAPEFAALRTRVSSDLAFAIEAGMRVVEHERPQTIAAFRELIQAPASASMRAAAVVSPPSPATGTPSPTLIPDIAQLATALNPSVWSRPEPKRPRRLARYAVAGVLILGAASAAAYIADQRSWLPEAFKRAGPETAPAKPITPAAAEEPKRPAAVPPSQADDAKRRAEEERKRAEDELKRTEEERRNKAMGDEQRRQIERTEGERRQYFDAQKAAEAERKRQEEQKAKTEAERKAAEERARAEDERKRADDERKRAEEAARKRQDDENARGGAERSRRSEERKRADDERRRAEEAARKRQDDENAQGRAERARRPPADPPPRDARDTRRGTEPTPPEAPDTRREASPPPPAPPGAGRDIRRQPPDVPPARGRTPPDERDDQ